ncbi:hypothetical protein ACL02P_17225 [Paenibacillus sp. MB22_1]|uniref:hypothetical protein n=1 Tax=Paenibacillus sp. MB22_1 TaxID=3383121 RepID=UPI00399F9405
MKLLKVITVLLLFASMLPVSVISAADGQESAPIIVKTEKLNYEGENFELVTWKNNDGSIYYTIPTNVKNKEKIAEYTNNYIMGDRGKEFSTQGWKHDWNEFYENWDRDGKIQWSISGFNEEAYLAPITENRVVINDGAILASYAGSGNADKIVVRYSYTFNGTGLDISFPPTLKVESTKVSWTSDAVTNTWYVSTPSKGGQGKSRLLILDTDIEAGADIYKGSYIYRPYVNDTLGYPYP